MLTAIITHGHYEELVSITKSLAAKKLSDLPDDYQAELNRLTALILELQPLFDHEEPDPFHQHQ
jgi:hypothetical protein